MVECNRCSRKIKLKKDELTCVYTISIDMHFNEKSVNDPHPMYTIVMCEKCYHKWSKKYDKFMNKYIK